MKSKKRKEGDSLMRSFAPLAPQLLLCNSSTPRGALSARDDQNRAVAIVGIGVLGAMMCAWEMTFEQEIGQVMAHLAAMSERTWSTEYRRDFYAFRDAFRHCYDLSARIIQDR